MIMRKPVAVAMAAVLMAALAAPAVMVPQALAQGAPQTVGVAKVDLQSVSTGFRTSKVVGSTVYGDNDATIGKVDDLIVTPNERVPFAVLSVGGFLGMGSKLVVVPYSALVVRDKNMVLPGATKDSLTALPEFKYAS